MRRLAVFAALVLALGFAGAGYLLGSAFPLPDPNEEPMTDLPLAPFDSPPSRGGQGPAYRYAADVLRVIDGDTLEVRVDLGFSVYVAERIRLRGVNAPELNRRGPTGEDGVRARDWVVAYLERAGALDAYGNTGEPVILVTHRGPRGGAERSFQRYVADVTLPEGTDLAGALVAAGHAEWSQP